MLLHFPKCFLKFYISPTVRSECPQLLDSTPPVGNIGIIL